jgi:hypothetical protein
MAIRYGIPHASGLRQITTLVAQNPVLQLDTGKICEDSIFDLVSSVAVPASWFVMTQH